MSDGQLDLEAMRDDYEALFVRARLAIADLVHENLRDQAIADVLRAANVRELLARVDAAQRRADAAERLLVKCARVLPRERTKVGRIGEVVASGGFALIGPAEDSALAVAREVRAFLAGEGVSTRDDTQ